MMLKLFSQQQTKRAGASQPRGQSAAATDRSAEREMGQSTDRASGLRGQQQSDYNRGSQFNDDRISQSTILVVSGRTTIAGDLVDLLQTRIVITSSTTFRFI